MQLNLVARQKWVRLVLWLVTGLLLLWALAWLTAPWLIKNQLQKTIREQLGRSATVGHVDFKPWTLELTINDLAIASQDGASSQFQLKRLYVNAEIESLFLLAPVVQTLQLEGPQLKLIRLGAGRYDIDDVLAHLARRDPGAAHDPLRFALFNLSLTGGALDFEDRLVQKTHHLRDLTLKVPFLSNLESRREIQVAPRLAFSLNRSRFDSSAQSTPFALSQKTDASINLKNFDLTLYLPYIPSGVPLQVRQAMLDADLKLSFEQAGRPVVKLSGVVQLTGVKLADGKSQDLLAFDGLKLALADVRPLDQVAKFSAIELAAPKLTVQRDASGHINLDLLASGPEKVAAAPARTAASAPGAAPTSTAGDNGWKVEVAKLVVRDGTASWQDGAISPHASLLARGLSIDATRIAWPLIEPVQFNGSVAVGGAASTAASASPGAAAQIKFGGSATDRQAAVKVSLEGAPLDLAAPYLASFLEPSLRGSLAAEFEVNWNAPDLQLAIQSLTLDSVALANPALKGKPDLASVRKINLSQARVDFAKRSLAVGKVVVDQPKLAVVRTEDKHWMFERWLKPVSTSTTAAPATTAKTPATRPLGSAPVAGPAAAPWSLVINELALDGGGVSYEDRSASKPVNLELSAIKVLLKDARPEGTRPAPVQLSARIRTAQGEPGQLDYRGTLQLQPMVARGTVVAKQIPLHAFEPYFSAGLNIELLRADASFKGDVYYAGLAKGPALKVSGDSLLEDFRANSIAANDGGLKIAEELLNWKALSLRGVDLAMSPGNATTFAVKETALSDFFARVIIHEDGRINLQDLVKSDPAVQANAADPAAAASSPAATSAVATPTSAAPVINIGPISLINGKVLFSDRFVKPNYSANLSELTGKLSAFSSVAAQGQTQLADLELRGRAEGTASLEILGKLNPLATPLALDIKGLVRDLELPPLSPYSVKYAGYGITRGKLSVDVSYLVLPNGQLTASNKLVLNQLTFGDKVQGAPNSLPVKLAVALLADRNGVIDIDLPVSGSLNDPQFRLGPIIVKVIVNLIVKAVTAPFSLLASAFGGGGDELSVVAFAPGSALLSQPAMQGLDKVAKALVERPALKMTVVGTSSLGAEREAYKRERLRALLEAEKRRVLVTRGASAQAAAVVAVGEAERSALLKEVYQRANITKPRNLLGLAKDIPVEEMEALLLANIAVTEDSMRELALQRGIAVKDYLGSRQLPVERLFLGAVKPAVGDPQWSPRAELSLANN